MREGMFIRFAPSERGNRVAIHPAKGSSAGDQHGKKSDADHDKPAEDADTSEQAPTISIKGHVDKLA
jgi:hypothetical protein